MELLEDTLDIGLKVGDADAGTFVCLYSAWYTDRGISELYVYSGISRLT